MPLSPLPSSSQAILEQLERTNLFLVPLDHERSWYRYHHLFAELLRVRLRQVRPAFIPELFRRAAAWFEENGLWQEATHYALQNADFEQAAGFIEQAVIHERLDFLFSESHSMIEQFPEELVRRRPLLRLAQAACLIQKAQLEGIGPLLRSIERSLLSGAPFQNQPAVLGALYTLQGVAASLLGDSAWILEASRQAASLLPEKDSAYLAAMIQLGNAYFYQGDLNQVDWAWNRGLGLSQAAGDTFMILVSLVNLGRLKQHRGELAQAEALFQYALRLAGQHGSRYLRWVGAAQRDYADLLREWNRLEEAQELSLSSLELCARWETASGLGLAYIHNGRIRVALGDLPGAGQALAQAEQLARSHTIYPDLAAIIQLFAIRLRQWEGDPQGAFQRLEACAQQPWWGHPFMQEWALVAKARLLIAQRRVHEALGLLAGRIEAALQNGRGQNWLELGLLRALALQHAGETQAALSTLQTCLAAGEQTGHVRTFLDEGEPLFTLLKIGLERGAWTEARLLKFTRRLLAAAGPLAAAAVLSPEHDRRLTAPSPPSQGEALSERELEVLRLLCAGLSNHQIAERLVVSIGTVKTHVHHIYGKLEASHRAEAAARARERGLI